MEEDKEKQKNLPSVILPWMYLGNAYHARDEDVVNSLEIKTIVNLCGGRYEPVSEGVLAFVISVALPCCSSCVVLCRVVCVVFF